ncbi:hypothetical protein ACQ4PT_011485 [Festuca glaucescens]
MSHPTFNLGQFLEKEKLRTDGSNFTTWYRTLRILLAPHKISYVLEAALGDKPADAASQDDKSVYQSKVNGSSFVQSGMLYAMEAELQKHYQNMGAFEMITDLKAAFAPFKGFFLNYNMQGMTKTLSELFAMLKVAEKEIKTEHNVMMVNKTVSHTKSCKKGKGNYGKPKKDSKTVATVPKAHNPGPKPDIECFYCKGGGHWKSNNPKYLEHKKADKFAGKDRGYPRETIGYTYNKTEGKLFVTKNGTFLKKEFLAKGVSGRKVELDEILDPALQTSSGAMEDVLGPSSSVGAEQNDTDHNEQDNTNHNDNDQDDEDYDFHHEVFTELRRSTRTPKTPQWYGDLVRTVMLIEHGEPTNYKEAIEGPESEKWLEAMKSKIVSMHNNKVWTLVDIPDGHKAIENKWIFKKNTNGDGNTTVYKARLVAKGFRQIQGIDYHETFSPVAMLKSIWVLLVVAAYFKYEIWQMDVKTTFLNGNIEEELYMVQPEGFVNPEVDAGKCEGIFEQQISMKDMGEASYILGIKIYRDRSRRLLALSQSTYLEKILKRFKMDQAKKGFLPVIKVVKNILKYLKRTKDMPIVFRGNGETLGVKGCTDASFDSDPDDSKSQTGYVFMVNGGAGSWRSKKQATTAQSTMDSEYIAASDAVNEAVWLRKFIIELGVFPSMHDPVILYCDK